MSKKALVPINVSTFDSNPAIPSPVAGDMYFNTNDQNLYLYTGTVWSAIALGGGGGGGGTGVAWWLGENS